MKHAKALAAIAMALALASCDFVSNSSSPSSTGSEETSANPASSSSSSSEKPAGYYLGDAKETLATNKDRGIFAASEACPSVGSPKMLVVPVVYSDIADMAFTESEMEMIRDAYTSTTLDDGGAFYSLEEYYRISSYGTLEVDVTIHDPMVLSLTQQQFEDGGEYGCIDLLLNDIMAKMAANGEDLGDYDSDDDGTVDGIHILYKTTMPLVWAGVWWHYCDIYTKEKVETSLDVPSSMTASPGTYFFSCFNTESGMDNQYYGTVVPDTHTIIHESGHMLGQNDFYDYDGLEYPAGNADMMDYSVGDNCAYTKMLFGWSDPYVVDGTSDDFSITLKPYESSGEFILLRNTSTDPWNGTPFDEYLTLSYYTPTGLNELDSKGYEGWYGLGTYSVSGLQVYHVDARSYVVDETTTDASGATVRKGHYYEPGVDDPSDWEFYGADNTGSTSREISEDGTITAGSKYRLMEAITSDGVDHFADEDGWYEYFGKNENLFGIGEAYGGHSYTNESMKAYFVNGTKFNDGTTLDYSFEVTAMDEDGITVHFEKA